MGRETFVTHGLDGVNITHEDYGRGLIVAPEGSDHVQYAAGRAAGCERTLVGHLDRRTVGHGVGKRHADLDHIGPRPHQGVHQRHRDSRRGITARNEGDQGRSPALKRPKDCR